MRLIGLTILAAVLCCGCAAHVTRTGWIDQQTEYPTSIIELQEFSPGTGELLVDLGGALAADLNASGVRITKRIGPDAVLEIEAATLGAQRSALFAILPAVIEQRAVQLGVAAEIAAQLADLARTVLVPVPTP